MKATEITPNEPRVKNAIILVGGKGTRLMEQTTEIPKPLVEVGGMPIVFHIINHFVRHGVENIVLAGGYKVDKIRSAIIAGTHNYVGDVCINRGEVTGSEAPPQLLPCSITIADTGLETGTAHRIWKAAQFLPKDEPFFISYGDNVSDVKLTNVEDKLFAAKERILVLTAVQYCERFGVVAVDNSNDNVTRFSEKSMSTDEFINGGFMAAQPSLLEHILIDDEDFSRSTMPRLQEQDKLGAYIHRGFWYACDTQRDWEYLNKLYAEDKALFG